MARIAALAALNGALAITFGTAGAHLITVEPARGWLVTASIFGLAHAAAALAVLALAPDRLGRAIALVMSVGAFIFASTLGLLAFGLPRWLGAVTPVGGTLLLLSWAVLAARFVTVRRQI